MSYQLYLIMVILCHRLPLLLYQQVILVCPAGGSVSQTQHQPLCCVTPSLWLDIICII